MFYSKNIRFWEGDEWKLNDMYLQEYIFIYLYIYIFTILQDYVNLYLQFLLFNKLRLCLLRLLYLIPIRYWASLRLIREKQKGHILCCCHDLCSRSQFATLKVHLFHFCVSLSKNNRYTVPTMAISKTPESTINVFICLNYSVFCGFFFFFIQNSKENHAAYSEKSNSR